MLRKYLFDRYLKSREMWFGGQILVFVEQLGRDVALMHGYRAEMRVHNPNERNATVQVLVHFLGDSLVLVRRGKNLDSERWRPFD